MWHLKDEVKKERKKKEKRKEKHKQIVHANKLRWYPQQPQRFTLINLSEACWEAARFP